MDCGKNIEQLIPIVAAVKLSQIDEIKQMSDQELICKYSEIMWDMETAFADVQEHGGLKWTGN